MKLLHQVWVQGEDQLPEEYQANRAKWAAALPDGWKMELWDDARAKAQWPDYAAVADQCSAHAMRADLILARAQRDFGGLAMGTDVAPHKPEGLFAWCEWNTSLVVCNIKGRSASNGVSWFSAPNHPFISCVCRHQLRDASLLRNRNVWAITGPGAWYEALSRHHWDICMVSDKHAYTRLTIRSKTITNDEAWVDPGYAASWH
jgi:hypothetical protein